MPRHHGFVSRDGDEDISDLRGFGQRHDAEAIHHRFQRLGGIDFGNDHIGAQPFGAHRHAAPAPAVSTDYHAEAGKEQVGGAKNSVKGGLTRTVAVVEEMLGIRIVHGDDGKL